MLCHKIFVTTKHKNSGKCGRHQRHQSINIFVLSIMWTMLFTETMARPNIKTLLFNKLTNGVMEQQKQDLSEMATKTNNNKFYKRLQKYYHNQPNYLNKWPGLRDLVSTLDYDGNNNLEERNDFLNTKLFERLRKLASLKSDYDNDETSYYGGDTNLIPAKSLKTAASLSTNQLSFKDHNIKKNVQYMSPCHFKICNMGRKRDAHNFKNY